jgi:hypothetical protein
MPIARTAAAARAKMFFFSVFDCLINVYDYFV